MLKNITLHKQLQTTTIASELHHKKKIIGHQVVLFLEE